MENEGGWLFIGWLFIIFYWILSHISAIWSQMYFSSLNDKKDYKEIGNDEEDSSKLLETDASQVIELTDLMPSRFKSVTPSLRETSINLKNETSINVGQASVVGTTRPSISSSVFSSGKRFFFRSKSLFPEQTPWNDKNGKPINDDLKVQLLYDIVGYLMMYGAPLYRVQYRLQTAADAFKIPVTAFFLPSDLMITVGDRTSFLHIPTNLNMYKLERVDRLAHNVLGLIEEEAKNNCIPASFQTSPRHSSSIKQDKACIEIERQLSDVVKDESHELSPFFRLLCACSTCTCLVILCFKGNFAEGFLGGIAFQLNLLASRYQLQQGAPIFVSFLISTLGGILQSPSYWRWASSPGLCAEYVIIVSLIPYMPGSHFALGMLEFTSLPVASLVRLFLGFMRSFQVTNQAQVSSNFK